MSNESIEAIAIGVGVSVSNKKFGLDLVGSGAGNQVTDSTEAYIQGSSVTTTGTGSVSVTAEDEAHITAIAGAVSIAVATKGGASAAVGASAAYNLIGTSGTPDPVWALIDGNSTVNAAGGVSLTATALPSISAYTLAGSGDFSSGGDGASVGIAGAGAGSDNQIYTSVQAAIYQGTVTFTTSTGGVNESATDSSDITAVAGGASIGGAFGGSAGVAVTVGAALAINDIYDNTIAGIFASTVSSANEVSISAANNETIWSLAIGVAGSLAAGKEASVAVGGAGSGSGNQVTDTTEALIANSGTDPLAGQVVTGTTSVTTTSGDVDLSATETVSIIAGAGTGAFTVGLGGTAAVAASIGVSVAVNTITDTVEANIDDSTVTAAGGVSLTASTQPPQGADSIKAVTVAGGAAVGVDGVSTAFPFAGAGSGNTITDKVTASITGGSLVTATSGDVTLSAKDGSSIDADGGGVTVAFALGTTAVAAGAGAGKAVNTITNSTKAIIDQSTVTAQQVSLTAIAAPSIVATAFGVAVSASVGTDDASIAAAGSGADAENTINDTTYASIQDGSNVTATATDANAVYVSAQNISSATAKSGAGSLGFSFSPGFSGSLAVGVVEANNNINDDVEAFISEN